MSFDILQLHIPDDSPEAHVVESVMQSEDVGPEEAILAILRNAVPPPSPAAKRKAGFNPITDEELANLDNLCPALKLLEDVTDEQWSDVIQGARKTNREGFRNFV